MWFNVQTYEVERLAAPLLCVTVYRYGVVLRKLDLMKEAVDVFVEATHSLPLHWGAWLELCNLITNIDMVHIQHHTVSLNSTHSVSGICLLLTLHSISEHHILPLNTTCFLSPTHMHTLHITSAHSL